MPGRSGLSLNLKKTGTNVAKAVSRGLDKIASTAANHGNKDIATAANTLNYLLLAGQIDTKLIPLRKEADAKAEIERRKAEAEAKKRALLKQLADLEKETETLNGKNPEAADGKSPEAAGSSPDGAGITYAFNKTASATAGTSTASGATASASTASGATASASAAAPDPSLETDDEAPANTSSARKPSDA